MPKATVSQETVRKELKTLTGGFVELKKLPFGLLLERRDNASKMSMSGRGANDGKVDIALMQRWSRQFEFQHCIVNHNLEDDQGKKLDFNNDMSIYALDPKIGQEIEKYLDDLNAEDTEEDKRDFSLPSGESSQAATQTASTPPK
jgi:hypothetical protein